jgi:ornithine decarboxylase
MMDNVCFDNTDQFYSRIQNGNASLISEMKKSTLFGMTCDGLDIISNNINAPVDAKVGDWFCFGGMGAYTHGSKTNFNGMATTEEVYRLSIPNIK